MKVARAKAIDAIYEAVEHGGFAAMPAALSQAVGARSATLQLTDELLTPFEIASEYFPESFLTSYVQDEIFEGDPWADILRVRSMREKAINCEVHTPKQRFVASRLWNDLIRRIGDDTAHCIGFGTLIEPGVMLTAGLHRPDGRIFDEHEVVSLEEIIPHARRAIRVSRQLAAANDASSAAAAALEGIAAAVLHVAPDGRIRQTNTVAERMLARGALLTGHGGFIGSPDGGSRRALLAAISGATGRSRTGGTVVLRDAFGQPGLAAEVAPCTIAGQAVALVTLREPGLAATDVAQRAAQMFGLTRSECEVAIAIAAGRTLEEICAHRATSLATVKTLLQRCFRKTGTARQVELAALLGGLR